MAFRHIVIENPAHVSVRNSQLIIRTDKEHSVPLEDVSALLPESRQTTITTGGRCKMEVLQRPLFQV